MAGRLLSVIAMSLLISLTITVPVPQGSAGKPDNEGTASESHTFKYTANVVVSMPGGHLRSLRTNCNVAILPVSATHRRMKVSDCLLYESAANESKPDTPSKMPHDTAKYDVKFSTEGGDIEIHPEESSTSLNFKRAILSLVTSTFRTMPETQTVTLQKTHRGVCKITVVKSGGEAGEEVTTTEVNVQTCSHVTSLTNHLSWPLAQNLTKDPEISAGTERCEYRSTLDQLAEVNCQEQLTVNGEPNGSGFTIRTNQSVILLAVSPSQYISNHLIPESQKHAEEPERVNANPLILKRTSRSLHSHNPSVHPTYTAMLMGENHLVTWDGRVYTLPDYRTHRCAYQLARDTHQHNFTLLQTRNMVELITHSIAVRVRRDGRVLLNRASAPSDLPVRSPSGDVAVTRRGAYVQVKTTFGFSLRFDTLRQNTLISISVHYHARSVGLLGTNDGRPVNDFLTRHGQVTHNVHTFIESYEVSSRPECHPAADSPDVRRSSPLCDNGMDHQCEALFKNRASSLSPCFGSVNPDSFKRTCQTEVRRCYNSLSEVTTIVCRLAAAYTELCREKGASVHLPTSCSATCGAHPVGTTWSLPTAHQVDAVLVTAGSAGHTPSLLLRLLTTSLTSGPAPRDLRLGLVAAGGSGLLSRHPYSYTFDGSLFSHHPEDPALSARLTHAGHSHASHTVQALQLAANYPFRPAAVKLIFLVVDTDSQQADTASLTNHLRSRGIVVNVIAPYPVLNSPKVVGLDHSGELLTADSHSEPLRAQVPRNSYAQLALQTKGMLLDPRGLSGDSQVVLGRALSSQVTHQGQACRRCTCRLHHGGHSISSCLKVTC